LDRGFVGEGRGGLSASQYADVMGLARAWVREGTGAIVADVPADTPKSRRGDRISVLPNRWWLFDA